MTWARRALLVALALNLVFALLNGWGAYRTHQLVMMLRETAAAQYPLAESPPPHECGSVIMPGESCEMHVILDSGHREPTY